MRPIYKEWLISQALSRKIQASDLLKSWHNPKKYDVYGAWTAVNWIGSDRIGSVSPLPDILKMAKGSKILVWRGLVY